MTGEEASQDDRDYRAIQSALTETERGRWFLSEHLRRHRGSDTQILLEAIGRIESAMAGRPAVLAASERPGGDQSEIALMITRIDVAFTGPGSQESLPRLSDAATSDVLDATERIQEAAWTLRERGADPAICDLLDQRATEIYAACAVQDGLARRLAAALELVRSLDERLSRTPATEAHDIPVASPPTLARPEPSNGPRLGSAAAAPRGRVAPEPWEEATAWPLTAPTHDEDSEQAHEAERHASAPGTSAFVRPLSEVAGHLATLDAIDALDVHERLRLFT